MATTIINPSGTNTSENNGAGLLIGIIILVLLAIMFFVFALPFLRNLSTSNGTQVNIPKSIDVNVNQPK